MREALPADVVLACEYELEVLIASFEEEAHFRRSGGIDELWLRNRYYVDRAASAPTDGDEAPAARRLLEQSIRGSWGSQYPSRFRRAGLVAEADLDEIVARIRGEHERYAAKAESVPSRLVDVARELALGPEPTGTGGTHWQARCPGTNHPLYIEAAAESFGCGWCKRKGAEAELRAFVAERARPRRG